MILVSPAERPAPLAALGPSSPHPERVGMDYWWSTGRGAGIPGDFGVQRKEVKDLLASIGDDRLAREMMMGRVVNHRVLLVEGPMTYSNDGVLISAGRGGGGFGRTWTRRQIEGVLWGVRSAGWWVERSTGVEDSARLIGELYRWSRKRTHGSLTARSSSARDGLWGLDPTDDEFAAWVVQSIEGVGPELAQRIVAKFGCPIGWRIGVEELMEVKGIGRKKAEKMVRALGTLDDA